MNFGRGGLPQTEELLIPKSDVEQFSPNMMLLFFYPRNDINDVNKETAIKLQRPFYRISENGKLTLDTSFSKNNLLQNQSICTLLSTQFSIVNSYC